MWSHLRWNFRFYSGRWNELRISGLLAWNWYIWMREGYELGRAGAECYGLNVCPRPKFITPSMVVFGDGPSKEAIKVKWGHKCGALTQRQTLNTRECCSFTSLSCGHTARRQLSVTQGKSFHQTPTGNLILEFLSPELRGKKCPVFKPPRLWHFVWQPK